MRNLYLIRTAAALLIGLLATCATAQTILLTPPTDPVTAGEESSIVAYYVNDSPTPVKIDAPVNLAARTAWTGGVADVKLIRDSQATPAEVQPGAFLSVTYRFTVPAAASGPM